MCRYVWVCVCVCVGVYVCGWVGYGYVDVCRWVKKDYGLWMSYGWELGARARVCTVVSRGGEQVQQRRHAVHLEDWGVYVDR